MFRYSILTILLVLVVSIYSKEKITIQQNDNGKQQPIIKYIDQNLQSSNNSYECDYVSAGEFYADGTGVIPNWWGFRQGNVLKRQYQLNPNMAEYMFNDTNPKGELCSVSWNKLFGSSRCGYLMPHHIDSDRFVWRRDPACLIFNDSKVVGEVPNCPTAGQVQIAAYAYDLGNKPYQNSSLLTQFDTQLMVSQNYTMEIIFEETTGIYNLYTSIEDGQVLLETHTIQHTACTEYDHGYLLGFYYGGECPAPDYVSVCYEKIIQ
ncbi:hypothetical protein DLAC_04754 [Tieghemostelium lacteum]|uniref:Transmembrane protein n=1 Tax=Tieghemostelium lacteum TaxID=361077 RepID=A0A151ZKI2_TIELA|nr:hypothetical protein DLAC_04754 [Tieghemostelium lacteum]|eukprot:KYQ94456.1 hypothetical protein DLAC_04754 [Tieghemostelium lacteum]